MTRVICAGAKDADMFYTVKHYILDPFFYIEIGKRRMVFLDHREYGVFKEENKDRSLKVELLNPFLDRARKAGGEASLEQKLAEILFTDYGLFEEDVEVPAAFPLDLADYLRSKGAHIKPVRPFYPERARKTPDEIEAVREAIRRTYPAFEHVKKILHDAEIDGKKVKYRGKELTSEFLKLEVERVLLENDMVNFEGMIIASAGQSAIPHHSGSGPIRPHAPIICDIFPRHRATGYFADMTRTFFKGEPKAEVRKMYDSVLRAHLAGIEAVKAGMMGKAVHNACVKVIEAAGYETGDKGFIHGAGHGLGLEAHEAPGINISAENHLEPGNIITIEPGLYYPELGGIRIEDDILVTEKGRENLTDYPKDFIVL